MTPMLNTLQKRPLGRLSALVAVAFTAACAGETGEMGSEAESAETLPESMPPTVVADVGFMTPESVLHETGSDVYLVSNINGGPLEADGNGFISRVSPDGEVLDLKWVDGAADGVTLNAPKGMAVDGELLYVTDIDCVRMFALSDGSPAGEVCIDGASFLNDLATHPDGGVLVTDSGLDASFASTGADALYHIMDGAYAPVLMDETLGAPNGVAVMNGDAWVVTFMSGRVLHVTGENEYMEALAVDGAQLDGIEFLEDGRAVVSNWATSCVHILATDGTLTCEMPELDAPADIGVDHQRGRVLVPLFNENQVVIIPLDPAV